MIPLINPNKDNDKASTLKLFKLYPAPGVILFGSSLDQSCWNLYIRGVLARRTVTNEATKAQVKRGTAHEMS